MLSSGIFSAPDSPMSKPTMRAMKTIIGSFIVFAVALAPQITQAQGRMTYLSNLGIYTQCYSDF
jgi:hypothetical protein